MSIFDSIISDITPFADALGNGISAFTGGSASGSKSSQAKDTFDNQFYSSVRNANLLTRGDFRDSPNPTPGQYKVTKSQADVTVDPEEIKQQWIRRLDAYSTVVAKSGVKNKGGEK